jgi:hypothetical protein
MKERLKLIASFLFVALVVTLARATEPPQCNLPGWPVTKTAPCNLCDDCQCTFCACPVIKKTQTSTKPIPTAPSTAPAKPQAKAAVAFVHPNGQHSHTCQNPNCPFALATGWKCSWTHAQNKSHECAYCAVEQTVTDSPARVATVLVDAGAVPRKSAIYDLPALPTFQSLAVSVGGCDNGNCAMPTTIIKRRR